MIIGVVVLTCAALGSGYWIGYLQGRVSGLANSPRLFVRDSRPWPVNAWSAPFRATGSVRAPTGQAPAK